MSLADEAIIKSGILDRYDTTALENVLNQDIPDDAFDRWFCCMVENKTEDFAKNSDYFNCWALKASILSNIEFLKDVKMKIYNITKEHQRLDKQIERLMLKSNANLEKI